MSSSTRNISSRCIRYNTDAWLQGPRFGNINQIDDPVHINADFVQTMILDLPNMFREKERGDASSLFLYGLLRQSLCHEDSRLCGPFDGEYDADSSENVLLWRTRLVYLSVLLHQNYPAYQEALARYPRPSSDRGAGTDRADAAGCEDGLLSRYGVGAYDYECPGTKYIVIRLGDNGLGINIHGGAVRTAMQGIASGRVVLVINHAPGPDPAAASGNNTHARIHRDDRPHFANDKNWQKPWEHASCPRGDYQCSFIPPTPCTITVQEYMDGYYLTRNERMGLYKNGIPPRGHEEDKVWVIELDCWPPREEFPLHIATNLKHIATKYVSFMNQQSGDHHHVDPKREDMIRKAARWMDNEHKDDTPKMDVAMILFFMRPNPITATKMNIMMEALTQNITNPRTTIGLPIRASDKCRHESQCLSFRDHMKALGQFFARNPNLVQQSTSRLLGGRQEEVNASSTNETVLTVLFTSESRGVAREQTEYADLNQVVRRKEVPFPFRIATNVFDVKPNTGHYDFRSKKRTDIDFTQDEMTLSALTTLKFQMLASVTIGNCCSNYHNLIARFHAMGCGAASKYVNHTMHCMQENEDPMLRICCRGAWLLHNGGNWSLPCYESKGLQYPQKPHQKEIAIDSH